MQLQSRSSMPLATTLSIPQPELRAFRKNERGDPVLSASKWAQDDNESDDEQNRSAGGIGLSYSSSGSESGRDGPGKAGEMDFAIDASCPAQPDGGMDEEQRLKMRRLEVALIEYCESLEEHGIKNSKEIERKVAIHRKQLQSEYGLSDPNEDVMGSKRASLERKDRREDNREPYRKRHRSQSRSKSPRRKSSARDRDKEDYLDKNRERRWDRDRALDLGSERRNRDHREKSASRERDDLDRERDRDWRRRRPK